MLWFEILIIVFCILFVGSIVFLSFYLKHKGKSLSGDCCGDCKKCQGKCRCCSSGHLLKEYHKTIKTIEKSKA